MKSANRFAIKSLFILSAVAVTSCGGGGGGSSSPPPTSPPPSDTTPPAVSSVTPSDTQKDAELDVGITIAFNETINKNSVSVNDFSVTSNGMPVVGTVSWNSVDNEATFTPDTPFLHLTDYKVSVGPNITDSAGNPMSAEKTWNFTTRDWRWGTPRPLDINDSSASKPHIAISKNDTVIISWSEQKNLVTDDWSARYTVTTGWESPQLIAESTTYQWSPRVTFLNNDAAFASSLLTQQTAAGTLHHVLLKKMKPDGSWGSNQPIAQDVSLTHLIDASGDGSGIVAWTKYDGKNTSLYARRLSDTGALAGDQLLELIDTGFPNKPRLEVAPSGDAIAVWGQWSGTRSRVYANQFDSSTGTWNTSGQAIDVGMSTDVFHSPNPNLSLDTTGNAMAVWHDDNGTVSRISAANYLTTSGWQPTHTITEVSSGDVEVPVVKMIAENTAISIWKGPTSGAGYQLRYSIFSNGNWSVPQTLINDGYSNWDAEIVSNGNGSAYIFWHHSTDPSALSQIFGMKYSQGEGFTSPENLSASLKGNNYMSNGEYNNPSHSAVINSNGIPMVTWSGYSNPSASVYVNTLE